MTFKPNLARQARLKAGSRPSLPGLDPMREEEWRIELTERYQPDGPFEKMWIEDIAYRQAALDVIRAQFAGLRLRLVHSALEDIARRVADAEEPRKHGVDLASNISPIERAVLEKWAGFDTTPMPLSNYLDDPLFAWLLGRADTKEVYLLRQLQIQEHEEVRERIRIINQFERRRRQQVWDAVELVEARRRAGLMEEGDASAIAAGDVDAAAEAELPSPPDREDRDVPA